MTLEELITKRKKIATWLLLHQPSHPEWERGAAAYVDTCRQIATYGYEALSHLYRVGDELVRGTILFPEDTTVPLISGTWSRLDDGRIKATVNLFQLRCMYYFAQLDKEAEEVLV